VTASSREEAALAAFVAALPPARPEAYAAALSSQRTVAYALGTGEAEQVAVLCGLKPVLRQSLPAAGVSAARDRLSRLDLAVEVVAPEAGHPGGDCWLFFAGPDPARVRAAARCEEKAAPGHEAELGALLGYPPCCVQAFLEVPQPRDTNRLVRAAFGRTRGPGVARLNVLDAGLFRYLPWFPCGFQCAPSAAFANAVAAAIRHDYAVAALDQGHRCPPGCRHAGFVEAIDRVLSAHRLRVTSDLQVSLAGRFRGSLLDVDRAWPTLRDAHPEVAVSPLRARAAAHLTALVADGGTVEVRDGVLRIGAALRILAPDAALCRFAPADP
jgi:hypothetical protein